jgi:hypothetical protein
MNLLSNCFFEQLIIYILNKNHFFVQILSKVKAFQILIYHLISVKLSLFYSLFIFIKELNLIHEQILNVLLTTHFFETSNIHNL